tara:strand:- start:5968 stop:6462 length:495 start_codon:yes stop_codon:yes gene_type:complete
MRKLTFSLALLSLILTGCAGNLGSTRTNYGHSVKNVEDPSNFTKIAYVDYLSPDYMKGERRATAELKMDSPDFSGIPENGYVKINISTGDIDTADSKWWTAIIVNSKGSKVAQKTGRPSVADYKTINGYTSWSNSFLMRSPIKPPFKVYVIDEISKSRWGYEVM